MGTEIVVSPKVKSGIFLAEHLLFRVSDVPGEHEAALAFADGSPKWVINIKFFFDPRFFQNIFDFCFNFMLFTMLNLFDH